MIKTLSDQLTIQNYLKYNLGTLNLVATDRQSFRLHDYEFFAAKLMVTLYSNIPMADFLFSVHVFTAKVVLNILFYDKKTRFIFFLYISSCTLTDKTTFNVSQKVHN